MPSESLYHKFAKDIIVIGTTNLLLALSVLILMPLLTKTLGASAYGIWSQADVTLQLAISILGLGLPFTLSRFLAAGDDKDKLLDGFYSSLILVALASFVGSILIYVFAGFIANAFFGGAADIVRITAAIVFVWSLDTMFLNYLRARQQMVGYSILMVVSRCAEIGVIALLVLNGFGLASTLVCLVAVRVVLLLVLFLLVRKQIGMRMPKFGSMRQYLNFSLPTVPGYLASWVATSSDRYIIGYFIGLTAVGIYSAGYNLVSIILMLIGVFGFVLPPTLCKLYDENRMTELKSILQYSLKYFLAVAIPFTLGVSVLSEPILRIFSTPEIASQNHIVVPLLAVSVLFWGVFSIIYNPLVLTMKTKTIGAIWVVAALVNVGLNIALVPKLGIEGAALGSLITFLLVCGIGGYLAFREITFGIGWKFIGKSLIASALMAVFLWLMNPQAVLATVVSIIIGMVVYALVIFLLKGFSREELAFIKLEDRDETM